MNKLWLDDLRLAPRGWIWAHSVDEAKKFLTSGMKFDEMSLDHDLGSGPPCRDCEARGCYYDCDCNCHDVLASGYDLLKWVHENNLWPPKKPNVHSQNPVGRQNMEGFIERYGPYGAQPAPASSISEVNQNPQE